MKCKNCTLFYLCIIAILSCCDGRSKNILGDFRFWQAGLESSGNIAYRSQSIIDTTAYVVDYWNDNRIIIAKTYWYREKPSDALGPPYYVYINMEEYRKEPNQLKSSAVVGPLTADSILSYLNVRKIRVGNSLKKFLAKGVDDK